MLHLLAVFALSLLLGGMLFFAGVIAPLVFTKLPPKDAGGFIRAVFPVYYLYVAISAAVAAAALLPRWEAAVMAVVALLTVWLRQGLMPRINRLSDAAQAGDGVAKYRFDRAHRLSVIVNFAQVIAAAGVLAAAAS